MNWQKAGRKYRKVMYLVKYWLLGYYGLIDGGKLYSEVCPSDNGNYEKKSVFYFKHKPCYRN